MDFFASQDLARRKTKWLVFYFIIAVICMIAGIYLVVVLVFGGVTTGMNQDGQGDASNFVENINWFDPVILGAVAVSVIVIVGSGSLFKIAALRGGGDAVAAMLGGRKLVPNSRDPEERRILNVVEEVALAAGTPVPPVYILDKEDGINAFAAGYTIDDAVIGVNRGTIDQLNRDELQGVIAHEFSHILNGDMRMSIRMIGVLAGIQLLALIGFQILRGAAISGRGSRDGKNGAGAILAVAIGVIVIGSIGLFFARLIKASVSRQREYLADASAVQFTRNPDGIAGALKMIGASQYGSKMESPAAEETSHMFFASMFGSSFASLFATHPPLVPRIQRIDSRFEGDFAEYARVRDKRLEKRQKKAEEKKKKAELRFPKSPANQILPPEIGDRFPIDPIILLAGIGEPTDDDFEYSQIVVNKISDRLLNAARDLFSARCLVFASLMDTEEKIRDQQMEMIRTSQGEPTVEETRNLLPDIATLDPRFRLPLFEILQGTLSGMSHEQYDAFKVLIDRLVEADREVDLFEFFLRHHLIVHLDRRFGKGTFPPPVRYKAISPLLGDIHRLLAILVFVGHVEDDESQAAFDAAMQSAGLESAPVKQALGDPRDFPALAMSLERLSQANHAIKKRVLAAAAIAVTHDQHVTVEEAELFRAMSESLDCPVPPVVASDDQKVHYIG